ncbi:MAG: hypothetical protein DMF68_08445 [Acidobacteria bacterium]|nr:MAG: hypothetical protein DMF68_08445 [Acidobacteriota bacterium]
MFTKHPVRLLSLILLACASVAAQVTETQSPTKTEQQEARERLEQKALALLEEVVTDAQSLKQAMNRLRIQVIAADLIWSHDEARARALFEKSIKDYSELVNNLDASDPNYYMLIQAPAQLYQEIVQPLVRRDPQMALDFVRHARPPQPPQQSDSRYVDTSYELQMETQIASQIVQKDPKLALQIGMESLDKGFSSNLANIVWQLQEKDRDGASRLASAIIKKLLAENLLFNNEAANVAMNMLSTANRSESHGSRLANAQPLIDDQSYKDLMELVLNAALNSSTKSNPSDWRERNISQTLLNGLKGMMLQVEKYAPSRASALQRKIADFQQTVDPGTKFWQDNQELFDKGSVDDILGLASKTTPQMRDAVYQQAAWKAIGQGDSERARQIINDNISNPAERHRMLDEIERQAVAKAANDGKLDQAIQALTRLRTNEERATALTQMANAIANKGDKTQALRLLEEARNLMSNRAENYNQLQVQLQVARGFATLDHAQSFEILEAVVTQSNELLSAAEVLNGFDQQYYKDGELAWQTTTLSNVVGQITNDLGQFGVTNFDRAKDIAARFQRPEVRIMAQLSIARAVLSDQAQRNFPLGGRRVMTISGGLGAEF